MIKRLALVLAIFAAVALTVPASPIHVSYVYSDSMEPTLGVDDGYIVVAGGEIERGDVVVFHSNDREEYVTHRVVDRTDAGYITKGDANDATDQSTGHPPVKREDVVGTVLSVGGTPITIPGLGVVISVLAANRLLVAGVGGTLVLGSLLYDAGDDRPARTLVRVSDVTHPLLLVALLAAVGMLLTGAVTHDVTYVAVDGGGGGPNVLTVGEPATEERLVTAQSGPFSYRMIDATGMGVTAQERNASAISAELRIPPQADRGPHETSLAVYRYPAVLPEGTVRTLHATSPVLAASTTVGALFVPVFLAYALLFDGRAPLRLGRSRRRPWGNR